MSTSPRPPTWLLAMALAAFAVQTDDFVIIGVLPSIASDTDVSEATAGQLVTAYSLTYALAAPLWAVHSSSVYVGAALGSALGGAAMSVGTGLIPVAAAVSMALGLLLSPLASRCRTTKE